MCINYLTDLLLCLWTLRQPLGTRRGWGRFLPVRQPFLIPLHPLNLLFLTHLYFLWKMRQVNVVTDGWMLLCQKVRAGINKVLWVVPFAASSCVFTVYTVWVCMDMWEGGVRLEKWGDWTTIERLLRFSLAVSSTATCPNCKENERIKELKFGCNCKEKIKSALVVWCFLRFVMHTSIQQANRKF